MQPTHYPEVNSLLADILANLQKIFGPHFVGLYLHGSLIIGDFDPLQSDLDLVAVTSRAINDHEFTELKALHQSLVQQHPSWNDRIEVCYITQNALAKVKSSTSQIVNISPGEPLHRLQSSQSWIMTWYLLRERALTLFGPSPKKIIEPLTKSDFVESVKNHLFSWSTWVQTMPKNQYAQSYIRLTLCRALYSYQHADQVSKITAAEWALAELPSWSNVINEALRWRQGPKHSSPDEAAFFATKKFVDYVRELILTNP